MTNRKQSNESEEPLAELEQLEDFLSSDQRMQAIAEVLASMVLDAVRKSNE